MCAALAAAELVRRWRRFGDEVGDAAAEVDVIDEYADDGVVRGSCGGRGLSRRRLVLLR
jgi:hypothetical protein